MTISSVRWDLELSARSSIVHGGELRGTVMLLRREAILSPDGQRVEVPVISGNALRGRLRRVGEELLRDALDLAGEISLPAATALRAGGTLTRTTTRPLTGQRLARVRELVPHLSIFGAALGSTIVDGALSVGKVYPHCAATAHLTGAPSELPLMRVTQLESYSRVDDTDQHDVAELAGAAALSIEEDGTVEITRTPEAAGPMRFDVETFPAGSRFSSWVRLRRPTPLELAFFTEVLETWAGDAHLGGRAGIGHGRLDVLTHPSCDLSDLVDWRTHLTARRAEVIDALALLP